RGQQGSSVLALHLCPYFLSPQDQKRSVSKMKRSYLTQVCALAASFSLLAPTGMLAQPSDVPTNTPIKHLVVIFQENISFDHYFATYPIAQNLSGETKFVAKHNTPSVNNLRAAVLLTNTPTSVNPFLLSPADAVTCDQNHDYGDEQKAYD